MFPLAYFITFRCYGTWLHGNAQGSVDRRKFNVYGKIDIPPNPNLEKAESEQIKLESFILDKKQREIVEKAILTVCDYRGYQLHAVNVRSNHIHTVVSAQIKPELIMNAFKSYATRHLMRSEFGIKRTENLGKTRKHSLSLERTSYFSGC